MRLRYFMLALGMLIIADAHIATTFAGSHVIVQSTCGALLTTLKQDVNPSGVHGLQPMSALLSHSPEPLLHGPVLSLSTFAKSFPPKGSWHQDQIHDFVHVYLF